MVDRVPARRRHGVAALPGEALVADRGFTGSFGHMEDRVRRGSIAPGLGTGRQSLHRQHHRRYIGRGEGNARTVEALGIGLRRIE